MITSTKLDIPTVTLSINDNIKFPENMRQEFKRTVSWKKYIFKITVQPKNNNLHMVDPTFKNINRLFVLSFENVDNNLRRNSFNKYYMPLVETNYFYALIYNKPIFDQPVKNKQEAYETCSNFKK